MAFFLLNDKKKNEANSEASQKIFFSFNILA